MNHDVAMQPPWLNGKWQVASLNKRGGYPICGCSRDEGHDTREDAERHHYATEAAALVVRIATYTQASPCVVCSAWTPKALVGPSNFGLFDSYGPDLSLCDEHIPATDEDRKALFLQHHPFVAGCESWHS